MNLNFILYLHVFNIRIPERITGLSYIYIYFLFYLFFFIVILSGMKSGIDECRTILIIFISIK